MRVLLLRSSPPADLGRLLLQLGRRKSLNLVMMTPGYESEGRTFESFRARAKYRLWSGCK